MHRSLWQHFDWGLLIIALLLTIIGVAMIYSATIGSQDLLDAWRKQVLYGAIGLVLMLLTAFINYRLLESLQWLLYAITILILLFTLLFGSSEISSVRRFIYIGGVSIQPAFPGLLLLIISQASLLARNAPHSPRWQEMALSLALIGVTGFLVFRQPNLSTATLYAAVWGAMLFGSGVNLTYLGGLGLGVLTTIPLILPHLPPYMQERIYNFQDPTRDLWAQYNLDQALISIGSGGLWGKGYASGTQSQLHFLRVRHTDFIFSVICEELGFSGALLLLILFGLLLWRLLQIAAHAADLTGQLIVVGVSTYIFYQLIVNLGMNLSLLPVAGLPLPFISSGGSALVVAYIGLGLVESVAMHHRRLEL
ncbi:MAG TPA: FtsW/RodA/SpoVE family cell cycle protein [Thermoflexia bacterium]|nr:FtsW/RodA/SpoVE family cell cycle protein [Thermoflexia bacterium]